MALALRAASLCTSAILPMCRTRGFRPPAALRQIRKSPLSGAFAYLAERGGFEPPKRGLDAYTLSRRAPSTTRTPLRVFPDSGIRPFGTGNSSRPARRGQGSRARRGFARHCSAGERPCVSAGRMDVQSETARRVWAMDGPSESPLFFSLPVIQQVFQAAWLRCSRRHEPAPPTARAAVHDDSATA